MPIPTENERHYFNQSLVRRVLHPIVQCLPYYSERRGIPWIPLYTRERGAQDGLMRPWRWWAVFWHPPGGWAPTDKNMYRADRGWLSGTIALGLIRLRQCPQGCDLPLRWQLEILGWVFVWLSQPWVPSPEPTIWETPA